MHVRVMKYTFKKNQRARYQKLKEGNQGYTQETNNMKNICRCEPSSVITHLWNKTPTSTE